LDVLLSYAKCSEGRFEPTHGSPDLAAHAVDVIEDAFEALGERLEALPRHVREERAFSLGVYRGLRFGLLLHPQFAPDLFLEGAARRQSMLSREHHGPRAVLNALERLASGYESECTRVRQDLALARSQLRDYQARLVAAFAHDPYLSQLTALRDQLKCGFSGAVSEAGGQPLASVSELAEQIKALKATCTIEASVERIGKSPT
jgi:hypothetical protein